MTDWIQTNPFRSKVPRDVRVHEVFEGPRDFWSVAATCHFAVVRLGSNIACLNWVVSELHRKLRQLLSLTMRGHKWYLLKLLRRQRFSGKSMKLRVRPRSVRPFVRPSDWPRSFVSFHVLQPMPDCWFRIREGDTSPFRIHKFGQAPRCVHALSEMYITRRNLKSYVWNGLFCLTSNWANFIFDL